MLKQGYAGEIEPRAEAQRVRGPLTVEVMDGISRAQDVANEIRHRLQDIRDRLFGPTPLSGADPDARRTSDCFTAEHSVRTETLHATLGDIDRLSIELANRL